MTKWQYYTHVETSRIVNIPGILMPLGEDGWELVTVLAIPGTTIHDQLAFIFKRPKKGEK